MDRFIDIDLNRKYNRFHSLKSNMDRFIVIQRAKCSVCVNFKIQYG